MTIPSGVSRILMIREVTERQVTKMKKTLLLFLSFAFSLPASEETLTPRQLFYSKKKPMVRTAGKIPAKKAAPVTKLDPEAKLVPAALQPLALRWSILQVTGPEDQHEVLARTFTTGDQVRLRIQPNQRGFLYLFARNASGSWKPLLANELSEGGELVFPGGSKAIEFKGAKGEERLFIVFSRQRIENLDEAMRGLGAPPRIEVLYAMAARDLSIEEVKPQGRPKPMSVAAQTAPADEAATYVASPSGTPEGRLVAEIKLTHQ